MKCPRDKEKKEKVGFLFTAAFKVFRGRVRCAPRQGADAAVEGFRSPTGQDDQGLYAAQGLCTSSGQIIDNGQVADDGEIYSKKTISEQAEQAT
jgi:hypothetical protein